MLGHRLLPVWIGIILVSGMLHTGCVPPEDDTTEDLVDLLVGTTYFLDIATDQWTEPPGVGEIIGSYMPTLLLTVIDVDGASFQFLGQVADEAGEAVEDSDITFPVAWVQGDLTFEAGPIDFPMVIEDFPVTIHNTFVSGTLAEDGSDFHDAVFEGVLDAREVQEFFATDADGVCLLAWGIGAPCGACPQDGESYCVAVQAEGITALDTSDPCSGGQLDADGDGYVSDQCPGGTDCDDSNALVNPMVTEAAYGDPVCEDGVDNDCDGLTDLFDEGCQESGGPISAGDCALNSRLTVAEDEAFVGYTLFAPIQSGTTYLLDICGREVHRWESDYNAGHAAYLLENGHLIRAGNTGNRNFGQGGIGGIIEEFDWDGNLVWQFEYSDPSHCQHHDFEVLPNGNVLMIAWENKTATEAVAAGRNPRNMIADELWPDHLIEVEPTSAAGGTIVWEWHVWDHLVQDYNPSADNYGVVGDHPELFDINFTGLNSGADWNHINSVDYNADLDQILLSFHTTSEIIVIDHSPTTEEAAGHSGGQSSRGGDILYRWGNPLAYDAPGAQQLFGQHDAEWIAEGLSGEGNILVFNNGVGSGRGYSSVDELVPPSIGATGNYLLITDQAYGPDSALWSYIAENPSELFSATLSGSQRLPNGNTLICNGQSGAFTEVTSDGTVVWAYAPGLGGVFRADRYGPDYAGFTGHDLDP